MLVIDEFMQAPDRLEVKIGQSDKQSPIYVNELLKQFMQLNAFESEHLWHKSVHLKHCEIFWEYPSSHVQVSFASKIEFSVQLRHLFVNVSVHDWQSGSVQ